MSAGPVAVYSGTVKFVVCRRLTNDWQELGDLLGIPAPDLRRFERWDHPPRCVWEWLEDRQQLGELRRALAYLGRPDLVQELDSDGPSAGPSGDVEGRPVNRTDEGERLQAALMGHTKRVVLVRGETGVGKSELVTFAVRRLAREHAAQGDLRFRRHQLGPGARWTTARLIEDIEDRKVGTLRLRPGEALTTRLRLALEAAGERRVVIVVDGAQYLLDGTGRRLGLGLDEALHVLTEQRDHNVRVVLVTTEDPEPGPGTRWFRKAEIVPLSGLSGEHFRQLISEFDRADDAGLGGLDEDALVDLCDLLDGNPRRLKVLITLQIVSPGTTLEELTDQLRPMDDRERERHLTERLIGALDDQQRLVLEALAVFEVPVPPDVIATMLLPPAMPASMKPPVREFRTRSQIDAVVRALTRKNLIAATGPGELFLRTGHAGLVLNATAARHDGPVEDTRRELFRAAANALSDWRAADRDVHRLPDLDLHFEELRLWLRSGFVGPAYARIDKIDQILQPWNRGALLLGPREEVRGRLSPFREMANENALGDIYASQGLFSQAETALQAALGYEQRSGWPAGRRKIANNLGSLHWENGDPERAESQYAKALAMAEEFADDRDQMSALEGLANCHRRRGAYRAAFQECSRALTLAQRTDSRNEVVLATQLSRWYTEVGDDEAAERLLAVAQAEAHRDQALTALCLDTQADLRLAQGRRAEALADATSAVNAAMDVGDPVTLVQARTTLAAVHLEDGDMVRAAEEIRAAERYRRPGRSMIVLAFQAVIALSRHKPTEARQHFRVLEREAAQRIGPPGQERPDFTAWDLRAVAVCGLGEGDFRATAIDWFTRARCGSDLPVPGLTARLAVLLDLIERHGGVELGAVTAAARRPCDGQPPG